MTNNKNKAIMTYKVSTKDWERMQDLIDRDQDGEGVASKIKDVNKAAARFIAGTVLIGRAKSIIQDEAGLYWSEFYSFAKKAVELGATKEDLVESLKEAQVPENFKDTHVTKKQYKGYTGSLNRFLDKMREEMGVEIIQGHTDYKDWSYETGAQYSRNGRVWPLNYKYTVKKDGKEVTFTVIVVTNEGGGLYGYDFNRRRMPWGQVQYNIKCTIEKLVA